MLLRRITEHVKAQNWTAVAIDFFIVVFGVFVGLQVNNWNAARADVARGVIYLERTDADLETDIVNYLDSKAFWKRAADYGLTGLQYVETGDPGDNDYWDILLAFYQASQVDEFTTTQTTYDELTSAGELRLFTDDDMRQAVANYYSSTDNPTLSLFPDYREHVRGIVPLDIQDYIWENCYSVSADNQQALHACDAPVDRETAKRIVDQISADTALMSELRYWISNMRVATTISDSRVEAASQLQQMIRTELGVAPG